MRKILLGLTILLSIGLYANDIEDSVENNLLIKYPTLNSGLEKVNIHEYDVDIKKDKIKLKIELKGKNVKKDYEKLSKDDVVREVEEIVKYIKGEAKSNLPVKVKIEIDNEVLPDEVVYRKIVK